MDINTYAEKKATENVLRGPAAIIGKNQQLFDLGLNNTEMENENVVSNKISQLDDQLHLVLIAEYFDESLVLLAKYLCWDLKQVRWDKNVKFKKYITINH